MSFKIPSEVAGAVDKDILGYDAANKVWKAMSKAELDIGAGTDSGATQLNELTDVTLGAVTQGDVLARGAVDWNSIDPADLDLHDWSANVAAKTVHDDNIAESNVTQHEAALAITESQITDLHTAGATELDELTDVDLTGEVIYDILYKQSDGKWVPKNPTEIGLYDWSTALGGPTVHLQNLDIDLDDLADVAVASPADGAVMYWNDGASEWRDGDYSDIGAAPASAEHDAFIGLDADSGSATPAGDDKVDVVGAGTISTAGSGNTLTISVDDSGYAAVSALFAGLRVDGDLAPPDGSEEILINTSGPLDSSVAASTISLSLDQAGLTSIPLDQLSDVTVPTPSSGDVLSWSGAAWTDEPTVASLNALTGALSITSSDSTITVSPSGSDVDLVLAATYLEADGSVELSDDWDAGDYKITAEQLESDIASGQPPLVVASTTLVDNLNADLLDGNEAAAFATAGHDHGTSYIPRDGSLPLTDDWDAGANKITALQFESDAVAGPPFVVASSEKVVGLNVDLLDGKDSTEYSLDGHNHDGADITAGVLPDARIAESSVIQHETAITHASLIGAVGTYAHSAVDTHLDDTSAHFAKEHHDMDGLLDDDHTQYLLANGVRPLTADWDAGGYEIEANQFRTAGYVYTGYLQATEHVTVGKQLDLQGGMSFRANNYAYDFVPQPYTDFIYMVNARGHDFTGVKLVNAFKSPDDIDTATDTITATDHGYETGAGPYQLATDDTLPAPLAISTDYWVTRVGADDFKLATSKANAMAEPPIVIDITTVGSGNHTIETDQLVISNHYFRDEDGPVRFTTTGTLPAGLVLATDYWIVRVDGNIFQVASSLANAQAVPPVVVDITDSGSGTHTVSPKDGQVVASLGVENAGTIFLFLKTDDSTNPLVIDGAGGHQVGGANQYYLNSQNKYVWIMFDGDNDWVILSNN